MKGILSTRLSVSLYKFDRIVSLSNSCTPISSVLAHFTKPTPLPCCYDNESEYIFVFNTAFYFTWFIILSPFDVTHHTIKYLGDGGSNVLPSITYLFVFLMWHSIGVTPFLPLKTCPDVMYRLTSYGIAMTSLIFHFFVSKGKWQVAKAIGQLIVCNGI